MAQPPYIYTPEEDVFWADVLRALENRETTREMIMGLVGISERTLKRRLARARQVRADLEDDGPADDLDRFDHPYMELVTSVPEQTSHDWCQLDSSRASRDGGRWHVGGKVRSIAAGIRAEVGGPTKYDPDPGLKGGVG